jgi:RimJ/RimL family protein N-acetyltransferase
MTRVDTLRLRLRQFQESDLDAYAELCADPEVMRFLGPPLSRSEAWRHMAMVLGHWRLRGFGFWAVENRETGEMMGRVGCWQPEGWPGLEVGWALRRRFWGNGYATEAAGASLACAFETLGAERVISLIRQENTPSIRVAERLGERFEAETEIQGTAVRVYAISRAAWTAARRP